MKDPITLEIMKEPITTPCGHTFDRRSLIEYWPGDDTCPICRQSIEGYDPEHAHISYLLKEIIEEKVQEELRNRRTFILKRVFNSVIVYSANLLYV
jgi:hypothetical protein